MQIAYKTIYLKKLFPLRISRGVKDGQHDLFISVVNADHVGWGEASPNESEGSVNAGKAQYQLENFLKQDINLDSPRKMYNLALESKLVHVLWQLSIGPYGT